MPLNDLLLIYFEMPLLLNSMRICIINNALKVKLAEIKLRIEMQKMHIAIENIHINI